LFVHIFLLFHLKYLIFKRFKHTAGFVRVGVLKTQAASAQISNNRNSRF